MMMMMTTTMMMTLRVVLSWFLLHVCGRCRIFPSSSLSNGTYPWHYSLSYVSFLTASSPSGAVSFKNEIRAQVQRRRSRLQGRQTRLQRASRRRDHGGAFQHCRGGLRLRVRVDDLVGVQPLVRIPEGSAGITAPFPGND